MTQPPDNHPPQPHGPPHYGGAAANQQVSRPEEQAPPAAQWGQAAWPNQQAFGQPYYAPPPAYWPQPPEQQQEPTGPERRKNDTDPGKFHWLDWVMVGTYVIGFMGGALFILALLVPDLRNLVLSEDPDEAARGGFVLNAAGFVLLGAGALAASWRALVHSVKTFAHWWWLKALLVPAIWFVSIIVTSIITILVLGVGGAEPAEVSANQEDVEDMVSTVPFFLGFLVIVLLAPYVEEYLFRHLLVGKLSRKINIWYCAVISIAAFSGIHIIPEILSGSLTTVLLVGLPYVMTGVAITLAYIWAGRSLFYAWLVHAFNNLIAILVTYYVMPWLEEQYPDYLMHLGTLV